MEAGCELNRALGETGGIASARYRSESGRLRMRSRGEAGRVLRLIADAGEVLRSVLELVVKA